MTEPVAFRHPFEHPLLVQKYYEDHQKLARKIEEVRRKNIDHVVFTGGVWDLIHPGHLFYLYQAKQRGHILVVGVDSDDLARKRKKKNEINRPVIGFEERVVIVAFLAIVDFITVVNDDIRPILEAVKPDVLVVSTTTGDLPPEKYDKYKTLVSRIEPLPPQAPPDMISSTARIRKTVVEGLDIAEKELLQVVKETFHKLKREVV